MIKAVVTAPKGHMGSLIAEEVWKNPDIELVGCVGTPGRDYIGRDIGDVVSGIGQKTDALVYDDIGSIIDECDVVIDFSTVELSMNITEACAKAGKAYLCGTTGFSKEETERILSAGTDIPVLKAANTSYVVTVMKKLLGEAAARLGDKCRIEIIDMHSQTKKDAPSGTAVEMAVEMAENAADKTYDDITFHSVRAGNTPSSHRVVFGCMGEKLEILHDAYDWRCYALGACDAAIFLAGAKPGVYTMDEVVK